MPTLLVVLLVLAGCASTVREKRTDEKPAPPPSPWVLGDHPVVAAYGAASPGHVTRDLPDRTERAEAWLYRFGVIGPSGLLVDLVSGDDFGNGVQAESIDIFVFGSLPLWPNRRTRLMQRPGAYYGNLNLKGADAASSEPWSVGLRYDLEAEIDLVKRPRFVVSLFGSGRIGYGWGESRLESINALGWGYEAGVRAQMGRFFGSLGWIDYRTEYEGDRRSSSQEYRFEGLSLVLGLRW